MSAAHIYVIVPNWNGALYLPKCLEALQALSYRDIRMLVVDNGSSDDSADAVRRIAAEDSRFELLQLDRNAGWCGAANAGLERAQAAGAEYALLLNNDSFVRSGSLEPLLHGMREDESVGALAPTLVFAGRPDTVNSTGITMSRGWVAWDRDFGSPLSAVPPTARETLGVCGAGMFLRLSVLDRVGVFPEDFQVYADDLDFCLRIWDAGYRIRSCPESLIDHVFGGTMGQPELERRRFYLQTRNRLRLFVRNVPEGRRLRGAAALAATELRMLGSAFRRLSVDSAALHLAAWFGFIANLYSDLAFRRARLRRSPERGRFWSQVIEAPIFFDGGTERRPSGVLGTE